MRSKMIELHIVIYKIIIIIIQKEEGAHADVCVIREKDDGDAGRGWCAQKQRIVLNEQQTRECTLCVMDVWERGAHIPCVCVCVWATHVCGSLSLLLCVCVLWWVWGVSCKRSSWMARSTQSNRSSNKRQSEVIHPWVCTRKKALADTRNEAWSGFLSSAACVMYALVSA